MIAKSTVTVLLLLWFWNNICNNICMYSINVNVSTIYYFMVVSISTNDSTREQISAIHLIVNEGIQEANVNDQ